MERIRNLFFYENYFEDFFEKQNEKVKAKISQVLFLITHAERIPEKFLKHIEGIKSLYEIRVELGNNIYRIFCCFDEGKIIVLFNCFQKKTQKTPRQEIKLAQKLMNEYFDLKNTEL